MKNASFGNCWYSVAAALGCGLMLSGCIVLSGCVAVDSYDALRGQNEEMGQQLADRQNALAEAQAQVEQLKGVQDQVGEQLEALQQELANAKESLAAAEAAKSELEGQVSEAQAGLEAAQAEAAQLKTASEAATEEATALKAEAEEKAAELTAVGPAGGHRQDRGVDLSDQFAEGAGGLGGDQCRGGSRSERTAGAVRQLIDAAHGGSSDRMGWFDPLRGNV